MHDFGKAMAQEQKAKGTNILLGPMVNIARIPVGGRNFESMGEVCYVTTNTSVPKSVKDGIVGATRGALQIIDFICTVCHYVSIIVINTLYFYVGSSLGC